MTAERPANAITHSCGAWWTGSMAAHCGGCHETFSSTTAFDRHQSRSGAAEICRDPAEAGLRLLARPHGTLWSLPERPTSTLNWA